MELTIIDESKEPFELSNEERNFSSKILDFAADYLHLKENSEMSVTFVSDEKIHEINKEYRDIDKPTDVISFAINDGEIDNSIFDFDLGDSFVSLQTVDRQAKEYNHPKQRELGYVLVHSLLHLIGYDHIEEKDAQVMFAKQEEILTAFGLGRDETR